MRVYSIVPLKEYYPDQEREDYFFIIVEVDLLIKIKWLDKAPYHIGAVKIQDGIDYKTETWIKNYTYGIDYYERCINKSDSVLAL
jgi:hypothetical protein